VTWLGAGTGIFWSGIRISRQIWFGSIARSPTRSTGTLESPVHRFLTSASSCTLDSGTLPP
jgi:hypothetical protein